MKVQELIAELSKFSPDAEVRYYFPMPQKRQVAVAQITTVELRLAYPQEGAPDLLIAQSAEGDWLSRAHEILMIR